MFFSIIFYISRNKVHKCHCFTRNCPILGPMLIPQTWLVATDITVILFDVYIFFTGRELVYTSQRYCRTTCRIV